MLSAEDNRLITDTDAGTPMGELFRRFWLPFATSDDLPVPDGAPYRVRLLGEDLVAFRDTSGRVGLLDAYCPHRNAPLFFGRNEESGLRCVYHGWKFDAAGACVDLPNAIEGEAFKSKVRIVRYPVVEQGGLLWAYMGPSEREPPFPAFEWLDLPGPHRYFSRFRLQCNYLQAMEGDYDPSHSAFLHMALADLEAQAPPDMGDFNVNNTAAGRWNLDESRWGVLEDSASGVLCVTDRALPDGSFVASAGPLWMMPVFCTGGIGGTAVKSASIRVPIDNENMMYFRLRWSYEALPQSELWEYRYGGRFYPELTPDADLPADNRGNDYNIDRFAQRAISFSGIRSFPMQDAAVVENQRGPISDRTREHLTTADRQIIQVRQRLLRTARALAEGTEPTEPWQAQAYGYHYESATGHTREEAIAAARAKATSSALGAVVSTG
jgi:phenylpropionate dioxygenase-like ring-hydroxylating dioxygenase large terminal subunit